MHHLPSGRRAAASRSLRVTTLLLTVAVAGALAVVQALAVAHAGQPTPPLVGPSYFAGLTWRSIGPPRSGYVSAPAGIPGDPTTYYAGMPEGGVWKTTNGGTTWKPIFDAVHVASVGAVAVAPSSPNTVYVGTGNPTGWSFTAGKGVYKSVDAGTTWTNIGLRASQYIGGIAVDPRNADVLLVAVIGPRPAGGRGRAPAPAGGAAPVERGVYRSTDGGRNWTRVLPADGSAGATDVYMDWVNPQIVYALLAGGPGAGAASQPAVSGPGAYRSNDGGVTWQPLGGRGLPEGARIAAMAPASGTGGRRLYAMAGAFAPGGGRGGARRGLYRSDDGGETWTPGARRLASAGGKMYADPQHPDVVYLMGTAIYRSTDAGEHVAAFWGAPSGADPRYLWIDPTNSRRMLCGVDQGAAITVDGGQSWTPYYGIVNGQFYRVATDDDFPYHVCGPQQDSGTACVASRSDFGEIRPNDWYPAGGFENGFLIADPNDRRYMYTQGWYHVLRRFDRMTGQVAVLYQPTPEDRFGGAPPLAFSPKDARTLYMAAQHVLASDDRGLTWRVISPDLAAPPGAPRPGQASEAAGGVGAPAPGGSITTLALSPVAAGTIWVGASTGLIHLTRDGGKTWANVTPPNLPPGIVNVIDASHAAAATAYVALLSRDAHPHFYRTSDYGANWQEISVGLTDGEAVRVVREDPADPNILYGGTVTSAWVSFDRGDHWQPLQLNLPSTVVSDLTVKDNDVVVSTYGRGFWILDGVSPLRQARAAMASKDPAFFFTPAPASRARWDNTEDTPLPPEMKVGDNPPEGAILDYYLAAPASGPVRLTISTTGGDVIREYSSVRPPPDTMMKNVPGYWIAPPIVLATTPGMHRVNWDLRYPDPPALNYGYGGTLLDYREYTLNWHALPGQTYRSTLVGPLVLPGTYTATLTVNGRSYSQPVTVVPDPRVPVTPAALAAQFQLEQRMAAGITVTYHAFRYIQDVRDALAKATTAGDAAVAKAAQALDAALALLASGPTGLGPAHRDLGRRLNDQIVGDFGPTPSVIAGVDGPCRAIDAALESLRQLQATTIAEMGGMLTRAGFGALPAWTPPSAPACGQR
jgi:photosystem II stability/assembly factor-like uncharacterized protein